MNAPDPYAIRPDPLVEARSILSGVDQTRALESIVAWLLESGMPPDKLREKLGWPAR